MTEASISNAIPKTYYRLRWRFDFADKKARVGVWNNASPLPQDSAWSVKKDGLIRAAIEGENIYTSEQVTLLECPGQDYATCQVVAYAKIPRAIGHHGTVTPKGHFGGMAILTRDEKITVYVDGRIERAPLTANEKKFDLHEHKLGV